MTHIIYSLINQGPTLSNIDDSRQNLSGDENLVEKMQGRSHPENMRDALKF